MPDHFKHYGEVAVSNLIVVENHVKGGHCQRVVGEEKESGLVEKNGKPQIFVQFNDQRVFFHLYLQFLVNLYESSSFLLISKKLLALTISPLCFYEMEPNV